ncbi:peritrophin-1-like [Episyrphus balteatus]|uniref:peritrophin-1-like n=1 Tax=Episyrphus balteatus TaxID=286459 RepID=UPI002484DF9B|nr:peritrophin-1-like [Episyrphus balteatus]
MAKVFLILTSLLLCIVLVAASESEVICPSSQSNIDMAVHLPSPTSCSTFYKCDRGVPVLQRCPPGLHFNKFTQGCDFPLSAGCKLEEQ